jgi:hypothetical protein
MNPIEQAKGIFAIIKPRATMPEWDLIFIGEGYDKAVIFPDHILLTKAGYAFVMNTETGAITQ